MALKKVMHGGVPLPTELQPVARIPPIGIKVPVREARQLGERAEDVLEDDEEHEQEAYHEREQQC